MGNLYIVATPIGNLKDITKRAEEVLNKVDIILCEDTRTSMKLLNQLNIKKPLISYHKFNEKEKVDEIIKLLKENKEIALISDAGTPCISDPGHILVKKAREENINVYGVGGISALITALSISGLDIDTFTFYGFFPRELKNKQELVQTIKESNTKTFVFYESPKRIIKTIEFIYQELGNIKISISKELTKKYEQTYYGNIKEVLEILKENDKSSLGEYTFIIEKDKIEKNQNDMSLEALLIDEMIKNNISLKEAINKVNKLNKNISKKDIYNASLNLKNIKF